MTAEVSTLFDPVTLAGLPLSSRFVMAPMTRYRSPGGVPAAEVAAYYRRRAENGVGLIITEGILVDHPSAGHQQAVPRLDGLHAERAWRRITDEVHDAGGRIAAQLWHLGSEREPADGRRSWTPSGVGVHSHAMTRMDIKELLLAYARSAHIAVRSGFDAIEIHAAHGYLLDEYLWPLTNRRTDRFGGDPAARAAFPAEVIRGVRAEMPLSMPLIVRFSQHKDRDYAARIADTPAELGTILREFACAGADVLHASQRRFSEPAFPGDPRNLAGWAKELTGLPAITVGSLGLTRDFPAVEDLLARRARGEFDLVALGRALLTNPDWVRLAGEGRWDDIRDYRKVDEDTYF
jgi:2,4-dienoyl-CoA reductase-like NADH-dependent reductase (Old Yellow Enzyme family)